MIMKDFQQAQIFQVHFNNILQVWFGDYQKDGTLSENKTCDCISPNIRSDGKIVDLSRQNR